MSAHPCFGRHAKPLQESFIQEYIASKGNRIKAICTVECSSTIEGMERFGSYSGDGEPSFFEDRIVSLFKTQTSLDKSTRGLVKALFARQSVEDTLFAMLVLINEFTLTSSRAYRQPHRVTRQDYRS